MVRAAKAVSPALDIEKGAELVEADVRTPSCQANDSCATAPSRPTSAQSSASGQTTSMCRRGTGLGALFVGGYVADGRGITLAPGSGIVLSELIRADLGHKKPHLSADISGLEPHRFATKRTAKL